MASFSTKVSAVEDWGRLFLRRMMKNPAMMAAITTTGITTPIAILAPVESPLLLVSLELALALLASVDVASVAVVLVRTVVAALAELAMPVAVDLDVEEDSSVLVIKSDACHRICTLYAFTASSTLTEKADVKVELFVATTVKEFVANGPRLRTQPYEVAKNRLLTWQENAALLRLPSAVGSGQHVALVSVAAPLVTSVEHATVYPDGQYRPGE